jgi:isopentenyl-diphosphate delta-isomerase
MQEDLLILVDHNDQEIGTMEKLEAHQKGLLHRAFSVLVFNDNGEILIHKRAAHKYHSAGLWTNTCCSHPRPSESIEDAAHRRLEEEMGFNCELSSAFHFTYFAPLENNLFEHELDHVLIGIFNENPTPNSDEVSDFKWIKWGELKEDIQKNTTNYTCWFQKIVIDFYTDIEHHLTSKKAHLN